MSESFDLAEVGVFTAGAIGPPGQRTFYLQARTGASSVAWKVEKQQVAALGEFLQRMLADLPQPVDVPDETAVALAGAGSVGTRVSVTAPMLPTPRSCASGAGSSPSVPAARQSERCR